MEWFPASALPAGGGAALAGSAPPPPAPPLPPRRTAQIRADNPASELLWVCVNRKQ